MFFLFKPCLVALFAECQLISSPLFLQKICRSFIELKLTDDWNHLGEVTSVIQVFFSSDLTLSIFCLESKKLRYFLSIDNDRLSQS